MAIGARARLRLDDRGTALVGVAGALLLVMGITAYLSMVHPPYLTDESSHVGYTVSLQGGTLPSLDTEVPLIEGDMVQNKALARPWPFSVPYIHVAINPPYPYLAAIPLAAATDAVGVRGGVLLGWRLTNSAGVVAAVGLTYLLGRELAGGDRLAGLAAAGLLAAMLNLSMSGAVANLGGLSLAATTAVLWALARFARTRSGRDALLLGGCCAVAAGVRPMALAFAAVAGLVGVVLAWRSVGLRRLGRPGLAILAPMAIFAGWWYALNWHRYGDPTGASRVYELGGYEGTRSVFDFLWGPEAFVQPLDYLVTEISGTRPWWGATSVGEWAVTVIAMAVLVGAAILAARARRGDAPAPGAGRHRPLLSAWVAMLVMVPVPMILIARHMSSGAAGHPRYLEPILPVLAAAVGLVAVRVWRWLPVLLVGLAVAVELSRIQEAGQIHHPVAPIFGRYLRGSLVGQPYRHLAVAMAFGGALALMAGLVATVLASPRARAEPIQTDEPSREPATATS